MKKLPLPFLLLSASLASAQVYDANGREKVNVEAPLPTGSNVIGAVTQSGNFTVQPITFASPQAVTGTFWQATQPVSGTFWQATQPVSGTITANAGSGTFLVGDGAGALNVIVDSAPTTAVTGTFWPTTSAAPSSARLSDGTSFLTTTGGRLSVDGSGVTQPVSGTFWQATQPVSGTVTANAGTGTFAVSGPLTDTQLRATAVPVSGTFWQATQPVSGTVTANAGTNLNTSALALDATLSRAQGSTTSGQTGPLVQAAVTTAAPTYTTGQTSPLSVTTGGALRVDLVASSATGAAPPAQAVYNAGLGGGATGGLLAAMTVCDQSVAVNVSTATTTLLITGSAGQHWRICSINLVTAAANGVALITGTGATCGTSTAAVAGGTTGATGWQFAANGGLTQGSGLGEIMSSKVAGGATGDSLCIVTSAATQLSGNISYALY